MYAEIARTAFRNASYSRVFSPATTPLFLFARVIRYRDTRRNVRCQFALLKAALESCLAFECALQSLSLRTVIIRKSSQVIWQKHSMLYCLYQALCCTYLILCKSDLLHYKNILLLYNKYTVLYLVNLVLCIDVPYGTLYLTNPLNMTLFCLLVM